MTTSGAAVVVSPRLCGRTNGLLSSGLQLTTFLLQRAEPKMEEVGDLAEVNQLIRDTYADLGKARRDGNTELLEARKAEVVILLTERERLLAGTVTLIPHNA
jgi:hypothetical protein